jgi:hypothetical protein
MTKFEFLDFASLEFAACSVRSSEFLRKYSAADGRRIESSTNIAWQMAAELSHLLSTKIRFKFGV